MSLTKSKKPSFGGSKPSLGKLGGAKPKAVTASQASLVKQSFLSEGSTLPLVLEPAQPGVDLLSWAESSRGFLETNLQKYGGILFRGFDVESPERFQDFIRSVAGEALEYKERSSPRSAVKGNIYTSTDYPPDQRIFFHNENSYAHTWPLKLFFFAYVTPETGGETPIADVRKVLQRISPETRQKFENRDVLYVRNFSDVVGLPWQTVFQTDDKGKVEEYCRNTGYEIEWLEGNRLRTRRPGPAVLKHPKTGERIWFNHATFFHISTMPEHIREALLSQFGEDNLPSNTYYDDGSPIEPEVLDELREAYEAESVKFPWQKGDVLMLDNMLVAHSRESFTGPRKILVGMAEPIKRADL